MFSSELSKQVFTQFFIALILYLIGITVLMVACKLIFSTFVRSLDRTLYSLLWYINDNLFSVLILCFLLGFIVLFAIYWRKTLGYIDIIAEASEKLVTPQEEWISLPVALKQVEERMNQVKQDALRNARLAKESEQRKNDLIVYLAHDIKTPLTSVIGYLSLMDEAPDMPLEQRAKYTRITLDKAHRLEQLINEFFEITRYNLQAITLSKHRVDLSYLLMQLTDEFYPQLHASGKSAKLHLPEDLITIGDGDKLARVFNNILKNAVAYSAPESVIDIAAVRDAGKVRITFENDGSIPPEKLNAIFEKFFRLDDARSSGTGGAGLGLAIAKEIVTLHGGSIYAKSTDGRTTFTVELPTA